MMLTIQLLMGKKQKTHCVKCVCVRSFTAFGHFWKIASGKLVLFTYEKSLFKKSPGKTLRNTRDLIFTGGKKKHTADIASHTYFI